MASLSSATGGSGAADHAGSAPAVAPVLCVDLDGTLIRTDMLMEGLAGIVTGGSALRVLAPLLARDRAALKRRVADMSPCDPALLPYAEPLIDWLRGQRAAGRRLVLATAADRRVADAIAAHLDLFDEVIASDGVHNLKGHAKAAALVARFGARGFAYAGNDASDLAVWDVAAGAVVVNASGRVRAGAAARCPVEAVFPPRGGVAEAALAALRPHHWVKNLLVFVPILTAHAIGDLAGWIAGILIACAFCATASSIYLFNDLADLAADRRHPRKRARPFASGALPIPLGVAVGGALLVAGLAVAWVLHAAWLLALYAALSLAYSMRLKTFPLVDVFLLAALYAVRLVGGGAATGHDVSLWLLAFSGFLFLGLALVKRVAELQAAARAHLPAAARRGYRVSDLVFLQMLGCNAAFAACIVLSLFVQSEAAVAQYASPSLLWALVPLMLFWQCRIWLATIRGRMHDDPIVFAARDRVSWLVAAAAVAAMYAAWAGVPGWH